MIVHLIPRAVFSNAWHGSYKDTASRVRFITRSDQPFLEIRLTSDSPEKVFSQLPERNDYRFLIEYSHFPKITCALRRRFPNAFIAVRSHNIEPLQHLDNHGWWSKRGPFWMAYGMARLAHADIVCKRYADVIYSISDWENHVYWTRLPGRARVEWLPYFCPEHLLSNRALSPFGKGDLIACLPTSQENRKSRDLVLRFLAFAKLAESQGWKNEFVITGDLSKWKLSDPGPVRFLGMVDDLSSLLLMARAVCLLSPLGYGFKTTMADALAHSSWILAHSSLVKRSPSLLAPALISCDLEKPGTFSTVLNRLGKPFPLPHINQDLQSRTSNILKRDFETASLITL